MMSGAFSDRSSGLNRVWWVVNETDWPGNQRVYAGGSTDSTSKGSVVAFMPTRSPPNSVWTWRGTSRTARMSVPAEAALAAFKAEALTRRLSVASGKRCMNCNTLTSADP